MQAQLTLTDSLEEADHRRKSTLNGTAHAGYCRLQFRTGSVVCNQSISASQKLCIKTSILDNELMILYKIVLAYGIWLGEGVG